VLYVKKTNKSRYSIINLLLFVFFLVMYT